MWGLRFRVRGIFWEFFLRISSCLNSCRASPQWRCLRSFATENNASREELEEEKSQVDDGARGVWLFCLYNMKPLHTHVYVAVRKNRGMSRCPPPPSPPPLCLHVCVAAPLFYMCMFRTCPGDLLQRGGLCRKEMPGGMLHALDFWRPVAEGTKKGL